MNPAQILQEKMAGEWSGEATRMNERKVTQRNNCKSSCEFLRLDNEEIEKVLKTSYRLENERKLRFLESLDLFDTWVQSDMKLLNTSSEIVEYPASKVVIKNMRDAQSHAYFIMSGQCKVVRQFPVMVKSLPFGKERITLLESDEFDVASGTAKKHRKQEEIKTVYLVIQMLKKGSYFGVDEDIGKSSVITATKTELLKIPRTSLEAQQRGSFFNYVNSMAMKRYPSRTETFKKYMTGLKWEMYKQGLVNEIVSRKNARQTACARDVPRCLMGAS